MFCHTTLLLTINFFLPAAQTYVVPNNIYPFSGGYVSQQWATLTPSYISEGGSGWYWCGHAAMAATINMLRQTPITKDQKVAQLDWFHQRLKIRQTGYKSDPRRQASIDGLNSVMQNDKGTEFSCSKVTTTIRDNIKSSMHTALTSGYYVVALSQKVISGNTYGHFYTVYRIDYDPTGTGGGTVFFIDPYQGTIGTMGYTAFLDGMYQAGTLSRYSFLKVKKL